MKMSTALSSIHAYLCADGYVIKNPLHQKHKYYRVGLRNTNEILLRDFEKKFKKIFGKTPRVVLGQRCEIGSKEIYEKLTKQFGSFYSWHWQMPSLNKKQSKEWLRSYFDCEGWVFCESHKNRHIGLDCVNNTGLTQIEEKLNSLRIKTIKKYKSNRKIYRLLIYGKENLNRFEETIGFFHPDKREKLRRVLEDFIVYSWNFPENDKECKKFVITLLREKIKVRRGKYIRIFSKEEENLKKLKNKLKEFYDVNSLVYQCVNGNKNDYYELNINKKEEVLKLIQLGVVQNLFKSKETY
jgi:hypothetical protein